MIRYAYINKQVLSIYSKLPFLKFPIDVKEVIKHIKNCRYMSYQKLAEITGRSVDDIILVCESKSGCTHYDISQNRYLILCNQDTSHNNNPGRQLWTCGHEVGHIVCDHHILSAYDKLAENSLLQVANSEYEAEADYFAATLLAPFPLFELLNIKSPIDVQNTFGLSCEASLYRYKQYLKWKQTRKKTAWENDMIRLYKLRAEAI